MVFFFGILQAGAGDLNYKLDLSVQDRSYIFSRSVHTLNEQLDLAARFALIYDNNKNFYIKLEPRILIDPLDMSRNRYLPDEAYLKFHNRNVEFSAGFQLLSWGVSRAYNPTNVINRPDLEGNYYRPEFLGEALVGIKGMIPRAGAIRDITIQALAMPFFLETPLPKNDTRFAIANQVAGAAFTSFEDQEWPHYPGAIGGALTLSATLGATDLALHFYHGPERTPGFFLALDPSGNLRVQPFYYLIDMAGFNMATALGHFTLRLETTLKITALNDPKLHQLPLVTNGDAIPNNYFQYVPGVDYTWDGFLGPGTLVASIEYLGEDDHTVILEEFRPLKNDLFVGLQWLLNDKRLTQFQLGVIKDLSNWETATTFEASTRLVDELRFTLGGLIVNQDKDPELPLSFFDNNTYVYARLSYALGGRIGGTKPHGNISE